MAQLKVPRSEEDFENLKAKVVFNPEEEAYWEEMTKRRRARVNEDDNRGKIDFYLNELKKIEGKFGDRIAVKRALIYSIGHVYEWLGTYGMGDSPTEGGDPRERASMFEQAVFWYQTADETIGYLSDCALRQSEACGGAVHFRKKAGLQEDETTRAYAERRTELFSAVLGTFSQGTEVFVIKSAPVPESVKKTCKRKS